MTKAARAFTVALALAALALGALATVPAADAAKPAKLGEKKTRQMLTGAERIAGKNTGTSGAAFAKTLNTQARHFDRYASKVRAGKCQSAIRKSAAASRTAGSAAKRHGPESAQYRKAGGRIFDAYTATYKRCR